MSIEGTGKFHPMDVRTAGPRAAENLEFHNQIPVIDLSGSNLENPAVAEALVKGLREIGFVFIKTPEINPKLPRVYKTFEELFYLPPEVLKKYVRPDLHYQRGFTPSRTEVGIYCQRVGTDEMALPDDKRAWFVGPEMDRDHYLVKQYPEFYPENIWPEEVPAFREVTQELRNDLYEVGRQVLYVLETHLDQEHGFFDA